MEKRAHGSIRAVLSRGLSVTAKAGHSVLKDAGVTSRTLGWDRVKCAPEGS
jgi:hypothetical protein